MRRPSAALVATAIGIAACWSSPSASPGTTPLPSPVAATATATGNPVPSPTTIATQPPSPTAAPTLTTTGWTEVYGAADARVSSLIEGPAGLIATACRLEDDDCTTPFFLLSDGATSWEEVAIDAPIDLFVPTLQRAGNRMFALGYGHWGEDGGAVILTSTDGRAWQRIESTSFRGRSVTAVLDTSFGLLAIGHEAPIDSDDTSGFVVWPVAADGSFGPDRVVPVTDDALYTSAIWTGEELLAWGFRRWEGGAAALLASSDGKAWTTRTKIATFDDGQIMDMVVAPDGLVAVGYGRRHYPLEPRAWTSPDAGRSWLAATVPSDDALMLGLARDGSRFVAQVREPSEQFQGTTSWASPDGRAWSRLPAGEVSPDVPDFFALDRATVGNVACVTGTVTLGTASRGAISCRLHAT